MVIDDEDRDLLSAYVWHVGSHGYYTAYRRGAGRVGVRRHVLLHHLILQRIAVQPARHYKADHINGDKLDNRRSNLRWVTPEQSTWNTRAHAQTGYKGVYPVTGYPNRFTAKVETRKRRYYLGVFSSVEEAARAYDAKVRELSDGYARVNFPLPGEVSARARTTVETR